MHFIIDGTLWEAPGPDGYDRMVERILRGLSTRGHGFTFVGKGSAPLGGALAPGLDWRIAPEKIGDRLTRDGWYKKSVPRVLGAGPMPGAASQAPTPASAAPWISWEGHDLPGNATQWLFLKDISDLLWPGPKGLSPESDRKLKAWKETLGRPGTGLVTFSWGAAALLAERWGVGQVAVGAESAPEGASAGSVVSEGASAGSAVSEGGSTVSEGGFAVSESASAFPMLPSNLRVLPAFYPADFAPATWEEKQKMKTAHSGGQEYFLWTGSPSGGHWMEALKAFSVFKRGQRSQMQLLLAPWTEPGDGWQTSLETYKYRADVRVVRGREVDWRELLRSAYAGLYLPQSDELGWVPGVAAELEVPLISTWRSIGREWASDGALWVTPESPDSIAEAMIGVYKDEGFRSRLLERARTLAEGRKTDTLIVQYEQLLTNGPWQ